MRKNYPELFDGNDNVNYEGGWTGGRKIEIQAEGDKKLWVVGFFSDTADTQWHKVPEGWTTYYDVIEGKTVTGVAGQPLKAEGHSFKIYTNFVPDYNK